MYEAKFRSSDERGLENPAILKAVPKWKQRQNNDLRRPGNKQILMLGILKQPDFWEKLFHRDNAPIRVSAFSNKTADSYGGFSGIFDSTGHPFTVLVSGSR